MAEALLRRDLADRGIESTVSSAGILRESAMDLVEKVIPPPTAEERCAFTMASRILCRFAVIGNGCVA